MRPMLIALAATFVAFAGTSRAIAEPMELGWPVACVLGDACYIQNYVDSDPGPAHRDFGCGWLTYNGTKGTDIALRGYDVMRDGVAVLAAADGVVKGVRDGMRDVNLNQIDPATLRNRFAGNGVVIDHGDGWETQYSHMLRGSVAVRQGDTVTRGQTLGLIGLSGRTTFPHLDFAVRKDGTVVDPFVGAGTPPDCATGRAADRMPLWAADVRDRRGEAVTYDSGGVVRAGFATTKFDTETALAGLFDKPITQQDGILLAWAIWYGGHKGDVDRLRLRGPNGRVLRENAITRQSPGARRSIFVGIRRPAAGWQAGTYSLELEVRRASGTSIVSHTQATEIR